MKYSQTLVPGVFTFILEASFLTIMPKSPISANYPDKLNKFVSLRTYSKLPSLSSILASSSSRTSILFLASLAGLPFGISLVSLESVGVALIGI